MKSAMIVVSTNNNFQAFIARLFCFETLKFEDVVFFGKGGDSGKVGVKEDHERDD